MCNNGRSQTHDCREKKAGGKCPKLQGYFTANKIILCLTSLERTLMVRRQIAVTIAFRRQSGASFLVYGSTCDVLYDFSVPFFYLTVGDILFGIPVTVECGILPLFR